MPRIPIEAMLAFQDELEKLGGLHPAVGAGALLGSVGGLGTGYLGYQKAKMEGAGTLEALGHGAKSGLLGAAGGAALGAGIAQAKPGWGKELSDFGQRQVHGLTGWVPKEGLHSIGHGAGPAIARRAEAHAAHIANPSDPKLLKAFQNADKGSEAARKAESMGMTSLPGLAKAVKQHGLIPAIQAGAAEQLHGTSNLNKAMTLGVPALGVAHAIATREDTDPTAGRGERIGKTIGGTLGSLAGSPLPMIGGEVVGAVGAGTGKLIGKGIDRLRGVKPSASPTGASSTDLTNGQATFGHEVEMSPRYSGTAMEGGSFG